MMRKIKPQTITIFISFEIIECYKANKGWEQAY